MANASRNQSNKVDGTWTQLKRQVKQKWGFLTENELSGINGQWDKLEGILRDKYGRTKETINIEMKEFRDSLGEQNISLEAKTPDGAPAQQSPLKDAGTRDQGNLTNRNMSFKDAAKQGVKNENARKNVRH